jgi:dihydrofolate reductase
VETLVKEGKVEHIYAIGGSQIYKSAFLNPLMDRIYLTRVFFRDGDECQCDTFMEPENFLDGYRKLETVPGKENFCVEFNTKLSEKNLDYIFEVYEKVVV